MLESRLERRLTRKVKDGGGRALKLVSPSLAGVPDRVILLPGGRAVFVEMKAPGETPTPLQQKRKAQLQAMNFQVYCLDSAKAVDRFVKEVFK